GGGAPRRPGARARGAPRARPTCRSRSSSTCCCCTCAWTRRRRSSSSPSSTCSRARAARSSSMPASLRRRSRSRRPRREPVMSGKPETAERLHALLQSAWDWEMREFPERATWAGYPGQNGRWPDRSRGAIERRCGELAEQLADAKALARAELSPADQLNLDLFTYETEPSLAEYRWPGELLCLTQMPGVHQDPAQVPSLMGGATERELDGLVARLEGLPKLIEQSVALLREGLAKRITPPRVCLRDVKKQIDNLCVSEAEKSPLL